MGDSGSWAQWENRAGFLGVESVAGRVMHAAANIPPMRAVMDGNGAAVSLPVPLVFDSLPFTPTCGKRLQLYSSVSKCLP